MEIIGDKIKLRSFRESDIDDVINWFTVETEWQNWDAPWEDTSDFDEEAYREQCLKDIKNEKFPSYYGRLEIEVIETGAHIGSVNSYYIDDKFEYTREKEKFTIGINIYNPKNREKGYGMEAWILFINYALKDGIEEIYTQTWSGNYPVLALMRKIGFELVDVDKDFRTVKGEKYDGYTLKLNKAKFYNIRDMK